MITIDGIRKLTDFKWLNLYGIDYTGKTGKKGEWIFASRKHEPPQLGKKLVPDAVVIVPIHRAGDITKLVILKEFRIPLGSYEWSFPAGLYEKNEDFEKAASRELKEETGLTLTKILHVSAPLVSSAGLSDESVTMVVVECEGIPDTTAAEETEDITVELLNVEEIRNLRNSDNNISAKTWPFLVMFEALGKVIWPV